MILGTAPDKMFIFQMVLRWGIVSAGKISNDFVSALKNLSVTEHVVKAVAATDKGRADEFAARHGILSSYGSYEALAADPDIGMIF